MSERHEHYWTVSRPGSLRNLWMPTLACKCGVSLRDVRDVRAFRVAGGSNVEAECAECGCPAATKWSDRTWLCPSCGSDLVIFLIRTCQSAPAKP